MLWLAVKLNVLWSERWPRDIQFTHLSEACAKHSRWRRMLEPTTWLKGGYQLQNILAAESEMPMTCEEKRDQCNEYLVSTNNQWLTNIVIWSNNFVIAFTLQAIDNVASGFCLLSWVAIVRRILPHKWPALPTRGSFALEPLMCRS
jgi:hypothetical protein